MNKYNNDSFVFTLIVFCVLTCAFSFTFVTSNMRLKSLEIKQNNNAIAVSHCFMIPKGMQS